MLDLQAINEFPARITLEEEISGLDVSGDSLLPLEKAKVELGIVRSDNVYYCTGRTSCEVSIECSRCLEAYSLSLLGDLDFSIKEASEDSSRSDEEIPDGEILIFTGAGEVDISGLVREALVLEIPLKPLCSDDCRGICPHCGINRNEQNCECRTESEDPRWDGLRNLRR